MWNEPSHEDLLRLPKLYETDEVPLRDKIIHMHFFLGGCDWYIAEFDQANDLFFGYAILNDDFDNAEWGYISYKELKEVKVGAGVEVDHDCQWQPIKVSQIERIAQGHGW